MEPDPTGACVRQHVTARIAATTVATLSLISIPAFTAVSPASAAPGHSHKRVCATASAGEVACDAIVDTDANGTPAATSTPSGFGATTLQKAYGIAGYTASGSTVAVVDAYNDPNAFSDVNTYRKQYGIPALSNAGAAPFFKQVSQTGTSTLPSKNGGWAQEISLDLDMVSASCPSCNILLVEAKSATTANLAAGVSYAKGVSGVVAVSNSYGGNESSSETSYSSNYTPATSGQWIVASAGDSGTGAQTPATYNTVVAAGGTSLTTTSAGAYSSETAWSDSGSGCSAYIKATFNTGVCSGARAEADVSSDADPNTGVAVYDSYSYQGASGWLVFGGTSASSPFVSGVHALAHSSSNSASTLYATGVSVHDVTTGSNGSCSVTRICNAGVGYDGPTGVGSPNGSSGKLTGF